MIWLEGELWGSNLQAWAGTSSRLVQALSSPAQSTPRDGAQPVCVHRREELGKTARAALPPPAQSELSKGNFQQPRNPPKAASNTNPQNSPILFDYRNVSTFRNKLLNFCCTKIFHSDLFETNKNSANLIYCINTSSHHWVNSNKNGRHRS